MKILVVDDDLELLHLIAYALRQSGYLVIEASDGASGLSTFEEETPDLVILDYNLPRINGLDVLRRIRAEGSTVPIMMLTVRTTEEDQVRALDQGADDYLTKPFSPRTLLARVRAMLRRSGIEKPSPMTLGDLSLDAECQTVSLVGQESTALTRLEFRLLQFMMANAERTVPIERLTSHVWGYRGMGDRQRLKQLVHRLRQKIEDDPTHPRFLKTVSGIGYCLSRPVKE